MGNLLMEEDAIPIRLIPFLRESFPLLHFIEFDPTENFPEEEHLFIVDTIHNTKKVVVWKDVESIRSSPTYSLHDFDLGMSLKIMKKMGKLKQLTIFGVPPLGDIEKIREELKGAIANSLRENASHN
jgi:Ni,Fe-hydrogenase maturation factor